MKPAKLLVQQNVGLRLVFGNRGLVSSGKSWFFETVNNSTEIIKDVGQVGT